ncbi:hypothetical protein AXK58_25410 [Tsukamurella tyrosinosolvens]|uniref:DUF218 domain-containing protein n=1 Tax=Tsukamurella tyrosinosolvens TaxID=57704 RepID=A0A1H4UX72_TSUTY|nr:YdcF family protein [Tsukamurella tyrosinosolvens]KXO98414.1 hypothetical protein AXK58_25410 [Tsukamurella tyrosinosolvens]SEC73419.1 DUF218 domain-containing protein [Tsukamurella tyrosinosolvens]
MSPAITRRAALIAALGAGLAALAPSASAEPQRELLDAAFERQAAGDRAGAQNALDRLPAAEARRAAAVMSNVDQALTFPLTDQVPGGIAPGSAIVVLGFGLLDDGGVRPILVERLRKGLAVAQKYPAMPVVLSGGAPRAGRTEAAAMRDWLVANGLPAARIHLEDRSGSTATNATNTAALMRGRGMGTAAVLVSSANHLRRSVADFLCAGITLRAVVASDAAVQGPPDGVELRAVYADARTVAGV